MIKLTVEGNSLTVISPYHPDFPKRARALGGRWSAPKWVFDARDEGHVRKLCREVYGGDGEIPSGDLVTLRITFAEGMSRSVAHGGIYIAGRCIAQAYGRDSGARLGSGVVVLEAQMNPAGGVG